MVADASTSKTDSETRLGAARSEGAAGSELAARYGGALFELAGETGVVGKVEAELDQLAGLLQTSPAFVRLVKSPVINRAERVVALSEISARAGLSTLVTLFLGTIAKNGRIGALGAMIDAYKALHADTRGETIVDVVSAQALQEEDAVALQRVLTKRLGRDIHMSRMVDPSLLGGLVVRVGSMMIDTSLRTKLAALHQAMKGA